jgi:hypothetical protein
MKAFALLLIPLMVSANECVLHSTTASNTSVQIIERADTKQIVTPDIDGKKRCIVSFRARIGAEWYTAHGEQSWTGNRPTQEMCTMAYRTAESMVVRQATKTNVVSDSVMTCSDRSEHLLLRRTQIGTVGLRSQFRPHPDRPREFHHNGTQCRWFLDTEFREGDVQTFQGIICHLSDSKWTVVDKF